MPHMSEPLPKPDYKSKKYLNELKEVTEVFMPNLLPDNVKPKAELATRDFFSKIYTKNMDVIKKVKEIEISQLLGSNDVVIPHIVKEYRDLEKIVVDLKKEYMKAKNLQEIWPKVQDTVKVFDKETIKSCLFDDLNQLKEFFGLEFDIKEALSGNFKPAPVSYDNQNSKKSTNRP